MTEISPKSRLTATLLAVFLGVFGAHRIYLEKTLSAVVMLSLGISGSSILGVMLSVRFDAVDLRVLMVPAGAGFIGVGILASIIVFAVAGGWAFVDFILIVSGKMKDRDGKPVKKWSVSA
jgi:hypothetical protein